MTISHFMRFPVESHLKMGYEIGNLSTEQVGKRKKKQTLEYKMWRNDDLTLSNTSGVWL